MPKEAPQGRVVHERYRLIEMLASGGFGRVWKAYDQTLRTDVAIKEMLLPHASTQTEREDRTKRAEREARNAARLRGCPNIVNVYDVFIEDGMPWVVMQLVDGESLAERLESSGTLTGTLAQHVIERVLEALSAAHAKGVVHRDIKPGNILLANDGSVLLTDFGTAVHRSDTALTQTGSLVASMEYVAPERLGIGGDQPACDLFSLGATMYQATEGVSPFRRDSVPATIAAILHHQPAPPENAGNELGELITRLLTKDPEQRPTAEQALAMRFARGRPTPGGSTSGGDSSSGGTSGGGTRIMQHDTESKSTASPSKAAVAVITGVAAFIAFGFFYGQTPTFADVGDCVWDSTGIPGDDGNWSLQPCSLPLPWETNYKVVERSEAGSYVPCEPPYTSLTVDPGNETDKVLLCLEPA